jgi:hypothetical protein
LGVNNQFWAQLQYQSLLHGELPQQILGHEGTDQNTILCASHQSQEDGNRKLTFSKTADLRVKSRLKGEKDSNTYSNRLHMTHTVKENEFPSL